MSVSLKEFPPALGLKKILGPSFIILALGLGSGEVILWPYLASNYGLGIAWGAMLGITFQFFINMEIERYALVKGESVFVGIARMFPRSVYWFIGSTFIGFGLPGIVAASAKVLSVILGLNDFKWLAIAMLVAIGLILSSGNTVYGMMERITKTIILVAVPFIFLLALLMASSADWSTLALGIIGRGNGYWFLPEGIVLATFLGAFAYSGAGGNLNLTQSIYIKEKGYGMGKYSQKIASLMRGANEQTIQLAGTDFAINTKNMARFRAWWKVITIEHAIVFLLIGSLSMGLLMLLSFATTHGLSGNAEGINFVVSEGRMIGEKFFPWVGTLFLLAVSIMLFQTQLGVMDSTSRIMAENVAIRKLGVHVNGMVALSRIYYYFVWAQIAFGVILFALNFHEPKTLIVLGAVINAVAMFVHVGLVSILNQTSLPKEMRPGWGRKLIIAIVFAFFGFFSLIVLLDKLGVSIF